MQVGVCMKDSIHARHRGEQCSREQPGGQAYGDGFFCEQLACTEFVAHTACCRSNFLMSCSVVAVQKGVALLFHDSPGFLAFQGAASGGNTHHVFHWVLNAPNQPTLLGWCVQAPDPHQKRRPPTYAFMLASRSCLSPTRQRKLVTAWDRSNHRWARLACCKLPVQTPQRLTLRGRVQAAECCAGFS